MAQPETNNASRSPDLSDNPDLILVGGGLANALIALRLAQERPDRSLLIIERGPSIGGNHTWSFHDTDIAAADQSFVHGLGGVSWPRQEVRFPRHSRMLETGYRSLSSAELHQAVMTAIPHCVQFNCDVAEVSAKAVTLADGRTFTGSAVIDGRGARRSHTLDIRFQKFLGIEYAFARPHGVLHPMIMDATVDQHDGYRFVYLLPFTATRLLIEDTYYADGEDLDDDALTGRIADYARQRGLGEATEIRRERGILPIALDGDIEAFCREAPDDIAQVGLRAALFHPTTGYSFPDAVRMASAIATNPPLEPRALAAQARQIAIDRWQQRGFFRLLNRMLFKAARGLERRAVLERFYTLPAPLIDRFYADNLRPTDKVRILSGRPPVPIGRALGQILPGVSGLLRRGPERRT